MQLYVQHLLDKIIETASIPEVRQLASTAKETLVKSGATTSLSKELNEPSLFVVACDITCLLQKALGKHVFVDNFTLKSCEYLSLILAQLIILEQFNLDQWMDYSTHYLSGFLLPNQSLEEFISPIFKKYHSLFLEKSATNNEIDRHEEGEELCNCEFSLAYGSRMLLNRTRLRLIRGQRYGLCGANGAGKSTLLRILAGKTLVKGNCVRILDKNPFTDGSIGITYLGTEWYESTLNFMNSLKVA